MNHDPARERLLELRRELADRHRRIDRHIHNRDEPLPADSQERASELANSETMEQIDDGVRNELGQIDRALARLDTGDYGSCESCQVPIPAARLEFVPFATRYGDAACSLGDLDGDGIPELAIGAPEDNDAGVRTGAVYIHSFDANRRSSFSDRRRLRNRNLAAVRSANQQLLEPAHRSTFGLRQAHHDAQFLSVARLP